MRTVMQWIKSGFLFAVRWMLSALRTRFAMRAVLVILIAGVFGGAYFTIDRLGYLDKSSDWIHQFVAETTNGLGLTVSKVAVLNNERVSTLEVIRASGLRAGQPIHSVDPNHVKTRIEELGWIRSASVRRALPNRVIVTIEERVPFAVWQVEGVQHLIDQTGAIIVEDLKDGFEDLVLVVGHGANQKAADLLQNLDSNPQLGSRVIAAVRVSDRRWNVQLDNEVDVRLPEDRVAQAWSLLADMQEKHRILNKDILSVDLRVPGQVILRTTLEEAERRLGNGKRT